MKSAVHSTFGEPTEVLVFGESAMPQPGSSQVRIKTILSPIHNHDLWTVRGSYGYKPELPAIGGTEAVGIIDALGEGVTGLTIGKRVAVASVHGTWAEYFLAPAAVLVPVPDAISDGAATQLIAMPGSTKARLIGELLRLVSGGELKLPVEAVFGLDQIADAVTASLSPGKAGKVLLKP